jgi:hypothetical protein
MASKSTKSRIIKNPLETIREIGDMTGIAKGVGDSLVNDLGKAGLRDLLGLSAPSSEEHSSKNASENGGFRNSGEIVNFEKKAKKVEQRVEAAIDYHRDILRSRERFSKQEVQSMNSQVQQIKMELQSLVSSSKILQMEFAQVTMDQPTENVGVYHNNFFEWVLMMIKDARKKVEDSTSWMNAQKSKGSKKGYWGMFKKHGTSFGLSNERSVATQVG